MAIKYCFHQFKVTYVVIFGYFKCRLTCMGSSLPFACSFFYLNFGIWHSMLSVYISIFAFGWVGLQGQQSPTFYCIFLHQVICIFDLYFHMHIYRVWLARAAVSCLYLLFHPFAQAVIWPVRQHVGFKSLTSWGADLRGQQFSLTRIFVFKLFVTFITYSWGRGLRLQGQQFLFRSLFKFRCCISCRCGKHHFGESWCFWRY